jgi:hypothetical protein
MRENVVAVFCTVCLTVLITVIAAPGMITKSKSQPREGSVITQSSQDFTYTLTRIPEDSRRYSLVISDTDEHTLSGTFSVEQLQLLRTIMIEAEKFAMNGEAVGTKEPVTTRIMDEHQRLFIVDVQKTREQSNLFLTIVTDNGRMTMEAGRTIRTTRREVGFFFDLLAQLESTLPKLPAQPR